MENNNPNNDPAPIIPDTRVQPVQPKSHLDKLAEVFLPEDLDSIGNRIFSQIVIPKIQKSAGEILHGAIDLIFGTNTTGINTTQPQQTAPQQFTSYRTQSTSSSSAVRGTMEVIPMRSGVYDYSIIRFRTVEDAQDVLNRMRSVISNTGQVSVGKYLEFSGAATIPEDFNYGWTNLSNVYVTDTGDREYPWRMVLPPTLVLHQTGTRKYI